MREKDYAVAETVNFQFLSGFQCGNILMDMVISGLTFNSFPDSSFRIPVKNLSGSSSSTVYVSFNSFPDSSDFLLFLG